MKYYLKFELVSILISSLAIILIFNAYYSVISNEIDIRVDSYIENINEQCIKFDYDNVVYNQEEIVEYFENNDEIYFYVTLNKIRVNESGYIIESSEMVYSNFSKALENIDDTQHSFNKTKDLYLEKNNDSYLLTVWYTGDLTNIILKEENFYYISIAVILLIHLLLLSNAYHMKVELNMQQQQEKEKVEMLRLIAHDLKTPLAVIKSNAECLELIKDEGKQISYIKSIIKSTDVLDERINLALDYSKLTTNDLKLNIIELDLNNIFNEICIELETLLNEKDLKVEMDCDYPITICADYKLMWTVLNNLLSNSIKYANGGSTIKVIIKDHEFEIANECDDLSNVDVGRLWDEFYSCNKDSTNRSSGLGLAICKKIFELHSFKYGCVRSEKELRFWFNWYLDKN